MNKQRSKEQSTILRVKYPTRIPVIVNRSVNSILPDIDKKKYLVPMDQSIAQFVYIIRRRIKMRPEHALFVFVNNVLPPTSALMSEVYEEHKDPTDECLYVTYSGENTFGAD
tara:strand:+ start:61 stop:396 length:336 start_codon:yes stop_codon:yes gene_type:complete